MKQDFATFVSLYSGTIILRDFDLDSFWGVDCKHMKDTPAMINGKRVFCWECLKILEEQQALSGEK